VNYSRRDLVFLESGPFGWIVHRTVWWVAPDRPVTTGIRAFAECFLSGTRQSPALGNDNICQEQDSRDRNTLGKDFFVECATLDEGRFSAKGRQPPSKADGRYLCREPSSGTRQRSFFAECPPFDTRQSKLCRVPQLDTRRSIFLFFLFCQPNFLWYIPTLCRPTCTILGQF
jgi:hypothetical protein